jgi:hypothetical protein
MLRFHLFNTIFQQSFKIRTLDTLQHLAMQQTKFGHAAFWWCVASYQLFLNPAPGVDVMITIFCDFWQFSAKKLAFFSKTNAMIKILHNLALL